jgi:cell division protein FtsL
MIRITTLLWIALLVVAGGTVMNVSYQVRKVERHLDELGRNTRQEQDAIRILNAEWDTLNDPHRIDDLAKRYLSLQPTPIARVVTLDAIPLKPSDDQLAKLVASAAKSKAGKPLPGGPLATKPEDQAKILTSATPSGKQAPHPDGIGLILVRAEAHR